jgi:hypothetical protein
MHKKFSLFDQVLKILSPIDREKQNLIFIDLNNYFSIIFILQVFLLMSNFAHI